MSDIIYTPKFITQQEDVFTPEQNKNVKERMHMLNMCMLGYNNHDMTTVDIYNEVYKKCREDINFWVDYFSWGYDPRKKSYIPFVLYPFQREVLYKLVEHIDQGKDLLVEKSRDMGMTYLVCFAFQWFWQFHKGFAFHIGSAKQDKVDILGDKSSIMEKIRCNIRMQPQFLLPSREYKLSDNTAFLKIFNPTFNSQITGESANPEFSRSGRYSAVLFDEFAFWQNDYEAWSAASDSTPCRLAISTPYGKSNQFAIERFSGRIPVVKVHWTQHPEKTEEWYANECERRDEDVIARELDISYTKSMKGTIYNNFDYIKHVSPDLKKEYPECRKITRCWDNGWTSAVSFITKKDTKVLVFDELIFEGIEESEMIRRVIEYTNEHFPQWTVYDSCDIAQRKRDLKNPDPTKVSKISFIDLLRYSSIYPRHNFRGTVLEGINIVNGKLREPDSFRVDKKCIKTVEALEGQYRFKVVNNVQKEEPEQEHPYEDVMDNLRYYIVDNFKPKKLEYGKGKSRGFKSW